MDVVTIGDATLYNGDCVEAAEQIALVDHTITDPPYEKESHTEHRLVGIGREAGMRDGMLLTGVHAHDFDAISEQLREDITRIIVSRTSGWALIFCQSEGATTWGDVFDKHGGIYRRTMIWVKPDAKPNFMGNLPGVGYEAIVLASCRKGQTKWNGGGRCGVFTHHISNHSRDEFNTHTTVKPTKLMCELVALFTNPGETIFDPFMGSGSTGVAAVSMGRKFVGIERDPKYFEICCRRIEAVQKEGMFNQPYVKTSTRLTNPLVTVKNNVIVDTRKPAKFAMPKMVIASPAPVIARGGNLAALDAPQLTMLDGTPQLAPPEPVARTNGFAMPRIEVKKDAPAEAQRRPLARETLAPLGLPPSVWQAPSEPPSLRGISRLSFDLETRDARLAQGLGPGARDKDSYVVGIAIGSPDGRRWYLPMRHEAGGNMDPAQVMRWARDELNGFDGELVGANLLYDLDFAATDGITFPKVKVYHDIQIAEPLLDEWRFSYSLEAIAQDYLGEGKDEDLLRAAAIAYGFKKKDELKANLWRLPAQYVGPYAEGDVDRPLRIIDKQLAKIAAEGLDEVYTVERKLMPLLLRMRRRGVRINVDKAQQARAKIAAERDVWLAKARSLAGPQLELMASDSFGQALIDRGIDVPKTSKTGRWSITSDLLRRHRADPLVEAIMAGRKLNTLCNTFFDGHILGHLHKGRIHCEFNQLKGDDDSGKRQRGTIARLSSSNPNLQNVPSREDEDITTLTGINIPVETRSCFEPEPGEIWDRLDESQVEYRLLAHRAVGPGAEECRLRYINDPKTDYHAMCAEMCGISPDDKKRRKQVKAINFAKGYGARPKMLAYLMQCSIEEATKFYEHYERKLPFTVATFNMEQEQAHKNGFIKTLLHRRQRFPFWEPRGNYDPRIVPLPLEQARERYPGVDLVRARLYTALNRDLQGSGADVMKKAMVDADEAGYFDVLGAPLLTVHDEIDLSTPQNAAGEEAALGVKRCMEQCFTLRVPLVCDRERGTNWGEAS